MSAPNLSVSYAYDADGGRVSKTVNGVKTDYLVDGNRDYAQVLEERVNNSLGASYVYGLDLISQERGVNDSYYLVDGLGSTRGLANGAGGVTDVYNYDAFGNLIGRTGSTVNGYLFAGEQYDSNLGGYYLRQRYYDQYRGRFASQDPFEGWMSDPMSLHNYLYAHANPVNAIDPSGLSTLSIGSQLDLIFAVGALAAISQPVVSTVFAFVKEGTPNEFPPAPPPFPIPRPSEPEILINRPPADGFPPSPAPFPVPQPERPEPLITRVPLLGLKEYLDNYVFSSEVTQEHLNQIRQIVNKYKNFECVECANEIKTYLKSQKIKGRHIRLDTGNVNENIYDDNVVLEHGEAISLNGKHEAILIEIDLELAMANGVIGLENATVNQAGKVKVVFDNHRPNGMIQESWLNGLQFRGKLFGNPPQQFSQKGSRNF
ncbi:MULTISPECIES: papain fold toxin domain-containing protein [unclassified Microcoleus]|uniref:papain fold toxin domain-containing protein n=1 Tax=unclassified Microcoleus TaxID=2642155 RepID=UPI001D6D2C4D|nr:MULTISPECIES: papain fold toxin domain-containing protein [unclassified Microcoleus]MCC3595805.1 hypothetical protein [Microcoleus sp. PH2017_26_ELK_O_A]